MDRIVVSPPVLLIDILWKDLNFPISIEKGPITYGKIVANRNSIYNKSRFHNYVRSFSENDQERC